jgi:hypothetical protein
MRTWQAEQGQDSPRQLGTKSLRDLRTSPPHRNHGARVASAAIASGLLDAAVDHGLARVEWGYSSRISVKSRGGIWKVNTIPFPARPDNRDGGRPSVYCLSGVCHNPIFECCDFRGKFG